MAFQLQTKPFFSKEWMKKYSYLLPRKRVEVTVVTVGRVICNNIQKNDICKF